MAEKQTRLSIVLRTVDRATAGIRALSSRLDKITKPVRDFKEALGDLREKSGLNDVISGFRGVGSAVAGVLSKIALIGGVIGAAVVGLMSIVNGFDALGDKAEAIGVSVDFLAQMRYAAAQTGAEVEQLDGGLQTFSKSLGQARAGTGRMASFLKKVSPALLVQLKAAKSNEAAFDLLAAAMAKLEDPAKRAALAQAALGDAALAPLFAQGADGIKKLREEYFGIAGSQEAAAKEAGKVDASMKKLGAATDGVKAALVEGLAPALVEIIEQLRVWLQGNRGAIKEWAVDLGKRLPDAARALVSGIRTVIDTIRPFVDEGWKLKVILGVLAAAILGPVIGAIAALGIALLTNPIGLIVTGIALAAGLIIKFWDPIAGFFSGLWDGVTSVFEAAWGIIKAIVDKVVWAVDKVASGASWIKKHVGGGALIDMAREAAEGPQAEAPDLFAQGPGGQSTEARVIVDITGAPRGTRVTTDPNSTANVDTSLGLNMLGAWP